MSSSPNFGSIAPDTVNSSCLTSIAPALPCFNSRSDSTVLEEHTVFVDATTGYPPTNLPLGACSSTWDLSGLKPNTSSLSQLPDSRGKSSGSCQGPLLSFQMHSHSNGDSSQHVFASGDPTHNAYLMSGDWQQMMFSTMANTTGMMPIVSPSSKFTASSLHTVADLYGNKPSTTGREPKFSFQGILLGEEASFFRPSPPSFCNPTQYHMGGVNVDKDRCLERGWNGLEVSNTSGIAMDPSKGALALQGLSEGTIHHLQNFACDSVFQETISMPTYYTGGTNSLVVAQAFPCKEEDKNMLGFRVLSQTQPDPDNMKPLDTPGCSHSGSSLPSTLAMVGPGRIPITELCADTSGVKASSESINKQVEESLIISDLNIRKPESLLVINTAHLTDTVNCESGDKRPSPHNEDSSASDPTNGGVHGSRAVKKRSFNEAKLKEVSCVTNNATTKCSKEMTTESASKLLKSVDPIKEEENKSVLERSASETSGNSTPGSAKENGKPPEPPKTDYIHVRARRGQATDSHSLAERVRREKISERMKFLQDLVPGCSKVTGKAVMLDEIINYVQSLQRQVEFLSMKLAAVNSRLDLDCLVNKEVSFSQNLSDIPPTVSYSQFQHKQTQLQSNLKDEFDPRTFGEVSVAPPCGISILSSTKGCAGDVSQKKSSWESELQSMVQMGFVQSGHYPLQLHELQGKPSIVPMSALKQNL